MSAPQRIQPGDLCRIVRNPVTYLSGVADRFITVVAPHQNGILEIAWSYEGPPLHTVFGQEIQCLPEVWLRPIGNPGADEVDEMVRKVGIPTPAPEGVPA